MKIHLFVSLVIGTNAFRFCTDNAYPTPLLPTTTTEPECTQEIETTGVFKTCPKGWEHLGKDCYKAFLESHNFDEARELCDSVNFTFNGQRIKAQLPTVSSPEINSLIVRLGKEFEIVDNEVWVGLKSVGNTDFIRWLDGTFVNYTQWIAHRPSNRWNESTCVTVWSDSKTAINTTQDAFWEAIPCSQRRPTYACQLVRRDTSVCQPPTPVFTTCRFRPSPKPCQRGWTADFASGTCYKPLRLKDASYNDFAAKCSDWGASLPSIHNDRQYEFIRKRMIGGDEPFWIGLKSGGNSTRNDNFNRFEDGTTLNYGKWRYVDFDLKGPAEQQCVAADVRPDENPASGWNLADCTSKTTAKVTVCAKRATGSFFPNGCESLISPNPRRRNH